MPALLFFLSLYFCSRIYYAFFSPLSKVLGRFLAKFTRLWQIWHYYKGQWHSDIEWLHETYRLVVRIALNEVNFVDQDALRKLYSYTNAPQRYTRLLGIRFPRLKQVLRYPQTEWYVSKSFTFS